MLIWTDVSADAKSTTSCFHSDYPSGKFQDKHISFLYLTLHLSVVVNLLFSLLSSSWKLHLQRNTKSLFALLGYKCPRSHTACPATWKCKMSPEENIHSQRRLSEVHLSAVLPQFNMQIDDIDFTQAGICWYSYLVSEWWTAWQVIERYINAYSV